VPARRQKAVGQDEVSVPLNFLLNLLTLQQLVPRRKLRRALKRLTSLKSPISVSRLHLALSTNIVTGVAAHFESDTDGVDANHVGGIGHGDEAGGKPAASLKLKCGSLGIRLEHH
jgi:hypothetical protein